MLVKNRVKLLAWLALVIATPVAVVILIAALGRIVVFFGSGADPESALNIVPAVPSDVHKRITWLPDHSDAANGRFFDPITRDRVAGAYLSAWAQVNLSHQLARPYGLETYFSGQALEQVSKTIEDAADGGWQLDQSDLHHQLQLNFYSDDGSVVSVTDHNAEFVRLLRSPDETVRVNQSNAAYDAVMLLEDGNWRVRFLVRRGQGDVLNTAMPSESIITPTASMTATSPMTATEFISSPAIMSTPSIINASAALSATAQITIGRRPTRSVGTSNTKGVGRYTVHDQLVLRDGEPFSAAGLNYYPRATPWTLFWPEYDPLRTRIDLDVIKSLGLNTVRIFVPFDDFGAGDAIDTDAVVRTGPEIQPEQPPPTSEGSPTAPTTESSIKTSNEDTEHDDEVEQTTTPEENFSSLVDFLDQAERKDIAVIVTLFDHRTDHRPANWAADKRQIAEIVSPLADHPAILAWDVKNEADRDYPLNTQELTNAWLRFVIDEVRRHAPHQLVTIGWSSPTAAAGLADEVDIVSYHYFEALEEYVEIVSDLSREIGYRPLMLQEVGLPTWNSIFPNGHTEAEQAKFYADILTHHRMLDTAGYLVWTLYDFTTIPLSQFRMPWQRGPQANMGVIRTDYTRKPAAALVAPDSSLDVPPVPGWRRFLKPFWLLIIGIFALIAGATTLLILRRRTF